MWVLYMVLLHIRRSAGLRGRRAAYLSSAVFVVMLLVWAANQFSQVHRFPAP
jgi:ABC-type transport system involved in cytochrome c biogenesis permease subunit